MSHNTKRKIPLLTPEYLAKAALSYLARFSASEASLRRVLENKLRRAVLMSDGGAFDPASKAQLKYTIEEIVQKYKKSGVLNDAQYALVKVGSLRRGGKSARAIENKLRVKGVAQALIREALAQNEDGLKPEDSEYRAAEILVKRRKLGAYRGRPLTPPEWRKDMAVLARAGFSSALARKALKCEGDDESDGDNDI